MRILEWLYWHRPIITTRLRVNERLFVCGQKYIGVLCKDFLTKELEKIRKTCHKKDKIDLLIAWAKRHEDNVSNHNL